MVAGLPAPALRRILENRFSELSAELETLLAETRRQSRHEIAEQLNQAVRRLQQASDLAELSGTLLDAAGALAQGAALFRIEGETAIGERIQGVSEEAAAAFQSLAVPLSSAAAMQGAVESRDRLTAATMPSEVSPALMELLAHPADGRVFIFPLIVNDEVPALLYTWGEVEGAALELLAMTAAAAWANVTARTANAPPAAASGLVQIDGVAAPDPRAASSWDQLSPDEQRLHLRAQRFARVHAAEMRLNLAEAVQAGRARRDVYGALQQPIDAARARFRQDFFSQSSSMVDYLHLELVRTLSNDDPELLGKNYPGPLV